MGEIRRGRGRRLKQMVQAPRGRDQRGQGRGGVQLARETLLAHLRYEGQVFGGGGGPVRRADGQGWRPSRREG